MSKIICGFPGIGKTHLAKNSTKYNIMDLDVGTIDEDLYDESHVDQIKLNVSFTDFLLTSTLRRNLDALITSGMEFVVVVPDLSLRSDYVDIYHSRNNTFDFIETMYDNWYSLLNDILADERLEIVVLKKGETLSDVIDSLCQSTMVCQNQ